MSLEEVSNLISKVYLHEDYLTKCDQVIANYPNILEAYVHKGFIFI